MVDILNTLGDIEKAISILSNIILVIYGLVSTIRSKKWKNTSQYLVSVISQYKGESSELGQVVSSRIGNKSGKTVISVENIFSNVVRFAPKNIKEYVAKVVKREIQK
ncbi:MAG: hypothetical protein WC755_01975 [Candidatus Woesearchaeota archaeon]|jgi:hypothetical protein